MRRLLVLRRVVVFRAVVFLDVERAVFLGRDFAFGFQVFFAGACFLLVFFAAEDFVDVVLFVVELMGLPEALVFA
mgnify:CR=1 FL=1